MNTYSSLELTARENYRKFIFFLLSNILLVVIQMYFSRGASPLEPLNTIRDRCVTQTKFKATSAIRSQGIFFDWK